MNISMVSPTTESSIKRLANRLKKQDCITHSQALDRAASIAGYSNFRHAKNQLSANEPASPQQALGIYITAYWAGVDSGRETLFVEYLPHWPQLLTRSELSRCRALSYFRGEAADHLVVKQVVEEQRHAIEKICHAARELQFMHATGLRPVLGARCSMAHRGKKRPNIPSADHTSLWRMIEGDLVGLDEPYSLNSSTLALRKQWALDYKMTVEAIAASVYQPDAMNAMYLIGDHAAEIKLLHDKISSYSRKVICASSWREQTHEFRPLFASPLQHEKAKRPRAPIEYSLRRASSTTMPMGWYGRRPNGKMPIVTHENLAKTLNDIQALATARAGITGRIAWVKNTLDDWVQREYTALELPFDEFSAMYFSGTDLSNGKKYLTTKQHDSLGKSIANVRATLGAYYPICAPVRELQRRLDLAQDSLKKWRVVG
jgi:Domain of unknown function (DUF5623)